MGMPEFRFDPNQTTSGHAMSAAEIGVHIQTLVAFMKSDTGQLVIGAFERKRDELQIEANNCGEEIGAENERERLTVIAQLRVMERLLEPGFGIEASLQSAASTAA